MAGGGARGPGAPAGPGAVGPRPSRPSPLQAPAPSARRDPGSRRQEGRGFEAPSGVISAVVVNHGHQGLGPRLPGLEFLGDAVTETWGSVPAAFRAQAPSEVLRRIWEAPRKEEAVQGCCN
ncbi:cuticle collagen 7-like [Passer montanus]|uniref:cuticle collagen 7-like n=1 Tax=Passer montanus TaxID=9160 RepID=UPI00195F2B68|nr:cuticle collagen 7-like [Passer montanus]